MDFDDTEEVSTADHNDQVLFKKCYVKVNEFLQEPEYNPWKVADPSVFLRYHCPECTVIFTELEKFSTHAMKNHPYSRCLFNGKLIENLFTF